MPAEFDWKEVLATWFGVTRKDEQAIPPRMSWWFGSDEDRDRQLEAVYSGCCEAALAGQLGAWQEDPHSRLALILLLDQFPRNLFRGTARAFAGDDRAAMLCLAGVDAGIDRNLLPIERVFFYMPLQHVEDIISQQVGKRLFDALASEQSGLPVFAGCAAFAQKHLDVIEKFGRFPHRNEALGRRTTPEEKTYLDEGGDRYGQ